MYAFVTTNLFIDFRPLKKKVTSGFPCGRIQSWGTVRRQADSSPGTCWRPFLETLVGCSPRQVWRCAQVGASHLDQPGNLRRLPCPAPLAGTAQCWALLPGVCKCQRTLRLRAPRPTASSYWVQSWGHRSTSWPQSRSSLPFSLISVQRWVTSVHLQLSDVIVLHLLWV